jgi:chloramphenicol O-acetyltransferase
MRLATDDRTAKVTRYALAAILGLVALNAFGGGIYGMAGARNVPTGWLEGSPFRDYLIPSVALFVVVGGACLASTVALLRRWRNAEILALAAGVIVLGWIGVQLGLIGYVSWLQPAVAVAGIVAIAMAAILFRHRTDDVLDEQLGRYTVIRPAADRQFSIDAFAALPPSHPMTALLELDVTEAVRAIAELQRQGTRVSLFAFLVRSIAVAISEHPDLNLVCHGKRLVRFDDVDVSVPVEVTTPDGDFPREVVLRRAQHRSPAEIYAELEAARGQHRKTGAIGAEDRWARRMMRLFSRAPRFARLALMRHLMRDAFTVKRRAGTTLVTSVGKFAAIPGFAFSFTTGPRASTFAIGSVVEKPWVHEGRIAVRSILALGVLVNHDLVDGGPAARFARRLQALVESAEGLLDRRDSVRDARDPDGGPGRSSEPPRWL